jgi:hypothetical protein
VRRRCSAARPTALARRLATSLPLLIRSETPARASYFELTTPAPCRAKREPVRECCRAADRRGSGGVDAGLLRGEKRP